MKLNILTYEPYWLEKLLEECALNMILCEKWYNDSVSFNPL